MATAKKSTTTKKSTSTSTAPKKPRTPKPVVEKVAEPDVPAEEKVIEAKPAKVAATKTEKVRVFIPLDPSETSREQIVHGSMNGKFYRLLRGKEHLLERGLAEHILFRIKTARELENYVEEKRYKG